MAAATLNMESTSNDVILTLSMDVDDNNDHDDDDDDFISVIKSLTCSIKHNTADNSNFRQITTC